jgi:predicted transcriptional regulator
MTQTLHRRWSFFTNHALVLICVFDDPDIRLRELGDAVGITERAAQGIISELVGAGYIARERIGRRNRYTIRSQRLGTDPLVPADPPGVLSFSALLTVAGGRSPRVAPAG